MSEKDHKHEQLTNAAIKLREAATELQIYAALMWGVNNTDAQRFSHLADSYKWQAKSLESEVQS